MTRLSPSLLSRAKNLSPLLPLVLRGCRSLPLAINELRWLEEHCRETYPGNSPTDARLRQRQVLRLCRERSKGVPLQYLLGTQPFGDLDILCRPGVLIPRPETESYTTHLAKIILFRLLGSERSDHLAATNTFRILDLCTGTGCISLLLHSLLYNRLPDLEIHGVDISSRALTLARQNLEQNLKNNRLNPQAIGQITFHYADLLSQGWVKQDESYDLVISNPPYISSEGYWTDTARSVRIYEPKLALVPRDIVGNCSILPADIFYPEILKIGVSTCPKVVLMEVADLQQASRVAKLAIQTRNWKTVEIWRDWPDQEPDPDEQRELVIHGTCVLIKGSGHGRSVVCWA